MVEVAGKAPRLDLIIPGRPVFRGGRTWIAAADGASLAARHKPDPAIVRALRRAHRIVSDSDASPLGDVAKNRTARAIVDSYYRALANLAYLAPDIQTSLMEGRQPAGLTLEHLLSVKLPIAWEDQRQQLGFKTRHIPC